ncbi:MAG TPA: DNA polymerase III subunit delta [Candidatus Magasanikbacteria bacterium]|nr:DNA polymerase III subunit delta [Candidatus Magasanikbacteria bacterium]
MIIFIHGEDTFRSRQFLKEQIDEFKKRRDPNGLNVVFIDGKNEKGDKIFQEITASPFLAERKMVVIKNILSSKDDKLFEKLIEAIKNKSFPEVNVVVFFQEEEIGKSKIVGELLNLLKKEKFVYEMSALSQNDLRIWAEKEIKNRGGKINVHALISLLQVCDNDSWFLDSLIDQLVAYKNGAEIESADVALFAEEKFEDNIFALAEAVVYGDKTKALKMINEQRKNGAEDFYLFSMILRQFRILTQAKDFLMKNPGASAETTAKEIKQKPFVIKKTWNLLSKDFSWFERSYRLMLETDLNFKSGISDFETLFDLMVEKI